MIRASHDRAVKIRFSRFKIILPNNHRPKETHCCASMSTSSLYWRRLMERKKNTNFQARQSGRNEKLLFRREGKWWSQVVTVDGPSRSGTARTLHSADRHQIKSRHIKMTIVEKKIKRLFVLKIVKRNDGESTSLEVAVPPPSNPLRIVQDFYCVDVFPLMTSLSSIYIVLPTKYIHA